MNVNDIWRTGEDSWRRVKILKTLVSLKKENGQKEFGPLRVCRRQRPSQRDRDRETERICAGWYSCLLPRKCNCQDYELISPPPSQSSPPSPRLSCLRRGASRLPGTRSDELTHTNGYTDFQHAGASLSPPLHSQYLQHPSTSQSLALCLTLRV